MALVKKEGSEFQTHSFYQGCVQRVLPTERQSNDTQFVTLPDLDSRFCQELKMGFEGFVLPRKSLICL